MRITRRLWRRRLFEVRLGVSLYSVRENMSQVRRRRWSVAKEVGTATSARSCWRRL
uniref:Uncharacterized protein n=1 Tax=Macrostomum lignano TaxID=282301 RepID=A0A1I8JRY7_9PLAT